jgi:hypothetical protein
MAGESLRPKFGAGEKATLVAQPITGDTEKCS